MIIEFSVENFRSIKELQTLNMTAANIVSKYKELDDKNVHKINDKLSLLKSKAIYGANASGKSNVIKALIAFISIVNDSVKNEKILEDRINSFQLSSDTEDKPSFFQMIFLLNNVQYRYGFEATDDRIISEWLFGTPGKKEVHFFHRDENDIIVNEKQFKEGSKFIKLYKNDGNDIARKNSLFLTAVKALNGELSKSIIDFISDIIVVTGLSDPFMHAFAGDYLKNDIRKLKISELLKIADTGINNVSTLEVTKDNLPSDAPIDLAQEIEKGKKRAIVITEHMKFDSNNKSIDTVTFSMSGHESEGSKKMFEISPFILKALEEKRMLVIDEFDARFHPLLTKKLIELFNSESNITTQFLVTTHDTNLLNASLLRRDQICFVEKDKYGATHIYNLADFKGIRNDASFEKDYISGKYGAIPFLGDFNSIIGDYAEKN